VQKLFEPSCLGLQPASLLPLSRNPLVSVLLTNYNYADYLAESIESVISQSYDNWELIICDDGSTDPSVSLIKSYLNRNRRISLLQKVNGGHTSALNAAFSSCSGEIVCLLDADDLFLKTKLASIVEAHALNPDAGLVVHRIIRVNQKRKRQGVYPLDDYPDGWLAPNLLSSGGIIICAPPTSAISFRRQIGEMLFPISVEPPLNMCPDQVIMRHAPLITLIKRISDVLAEYRVHGANAYSSAEVSINGVSRQLQVSKALWNEQRRFLARTHPDVVHHLADLSNSSHTAVLQYVEAKLQRHRDVRIYLDRYLDLCQRSGELKWARFWQFSIHLPNAIFRRAVGLLTGQSALKQFVTRLKKFT
jgi:glycosyltransferase involved in cell wall biosynthesis